MKLLVTGGLGFIGSNFVLNEIEKGVEIVNIDKIGVGANPSSLKYVEGLPGYRFIKGDISVRQALEKVMAEVDVVINFAAETHVDRSISHPNLFLESNIVGTFNLLETERRSDREIRHIQVSTDEVYGDIIEGSHTEDDLLKPSNPYSWTKASADLLCKSYVRTYGMDIIVTRCTNNYGPRQFPEKLIPKTILRALNNLEIPVYGTGENVRDWIYIVDHCRALDLVLEEGKSGEIYNVSSGQEKSVMDIVKIILDLLEKPEGLIKHVEDRPGHDIRYSLDSSKLENAFGWKPIHEFEEALAQTVEWYLENEWWWKPIITPQVLHPTPWRL